jgi:hypothetical protein
MAQDIFTAENGETFSFVNLPGQQIDVSTTIAETAQPVDAAQQLRIDKANDGFSTVLVLGLGALSIVALYNHFVPGRHGSNN